MVDASYHLKDVRALGRLLGDPDLAKGLLEATKSWEGAPHGVSPSKSLGNLISDSLVAVGANLKQHPHRALLFRLMQDDRSLTDEEVGQVLEMIYSHMVNRFKGDLAEILAINPASRFLRGLKKEGIAPPHARYVMGPSILEPGQRRKGWAKGADGLFVADRNQRGGRMSGEPLTIYGIVEVKSYQLGERVGRGQLEKHQARLKRGLRIDNIDYSGSQVILAGSRGSKRKPLTIGGMGPTRPYYLFILPKARNRPPRQASPKGTWLRLLEIPYDRVRIMSAAYEMTFWFFSLLGDQAYQNSPVPWRGMTPPEAGRNQIKLALYYIMLRDMRGLVEFGVNTNAWHRRRDRLMRIATRLYNSYGWGLERAVLHKGMLWQETDTRTGSVRFTETPP